MTRVATNLDGSWLDVHHRAKAVERKSMIRDLAISAGGSVLDAGCGRGGFARLIADVWAPSALVCVDRDANHLEFARELLDDYPYVEFLLADIGSISIDRRFDLVWSANVLEYFEEPDFAIAHLASTVKRGGLLAIKDEDATRDIFLNWPTEIELAVNIAWRDICHGMRNVWRSDFGRELPERLSKLNLGELSVKTYVIERFGTASLELACYLSSAFLKYRDDFKLRLSESEYKLFVEYLTPCSDNNLFDRPYFHYIGLETVCTVRIR